MKKLIAILLFSLCVIVAQTGLRDYEELLKQYPQLSPFTTNRVGFLPTPPAQGTQFDFSDYTEAELLMLDSLGVLSVLLDTIKVEEPVYFGYNFFNTPEKFAIFDNIPIPGNYRLGAGDQLIISIWGATQFRSRHMINREGDIFLDGVGEVNLSGMDITTAENMLKERFSEVYSTLKGKRPSTFLSVSLGQLKSINISFVGEVNTPGIHAVHPFSDITTALLQVGGVDTVGSLRNIQVIRDGKVFTKLDFYEYLVNGKTAQNTRLLNGDVIFIPVRQSTVSIEGEVNRPGNYEAKDGESIANLIHFAGGLTQRAQPNIEIYRLLPREQRPSEDFAYEVFYVDPEQAQFELAKDIIRLRVLSVPDVSREVAIFGQVKLPGIYAYENSMKVMDLLKIAGGLNDTTFMKSIYLEEAEIIRQDPNSTYPQIIPINLEQLINGQNDQNIELFNQDIVLIRENRYFSAPKYVTIGGQVNIPGKYTIQQKEETLKNIISRAGGFTSNAYIDGLHMYRDTLQVVLHGTDIFVTDGDSVYVPEPPGIVKIFGQVQREGLVQYIKGKSLSYYIERAGGYTYDADKKRVVVHYANGDVRLKKNYLLSLVSLTPPIKDGATIYVYRKETKPPFNPAQFLTAAASAASSIVTLYLLYEATKPAN